MVERLDLEALDNALLKAHAQGNLEALVDLYKQAGDGLIEKDIDGACFYYTHALVFALELGDQRANEIRDILILNGREETV